MRKPQSTFDLSLIELIIIVLCVVVGFAYSQNISSVDGIERLEIAINELNQKLASSQEKVELYDRMQKDFAESGIQVENIKDELERLLNLTSENDSLSGIISTYVDEVGTIDEIIGSGKGLCWENEEGKSIPAFEITLFDDGFGVRAIWEFDEGVADMSRALSNSFYQELNRDILIKLSNDEFIKNFLPLKEYADNLAPPCYYVAIPKDLTTTKETYINQLAILERYFVRGYVQIQ